MINRIVSFFILCLVLCIPLCVAYFHSGELMMRFVFFWPFFMSIMWIVGGVYFWVYRERHWPWGENAPAPQLKDNPSISIIIPCFNEEKNVEETIHAAGNDSNLLIVFYVQIMPDDFVMQLHR
ncbi:glycosyltransferase family 2 protein, partial [Escherichia coli]